MSGLANSLYLAGSFYDFRDKIIASAPFNVVDARNNPQHAMFETNKADLEAAIETPAFGLCLPKGKPAGVMTMVELGAAYSSGSEIIVANEVEGELDLPTGMLLKNASRHYFRSIDDMVSFFQGYTLPEKSPAKRPAEKAGPVKRIAVYGLEPDALDVKGKEVVQGAYTIKDAKEFEAGKVDILAVGFPRGKPHDRFACFMMGAATFHRVPIIVYTDRKAPYPPLTGGLQRRLFTDMDAVKYYLQSVQSQDITTESRVMYEIFKKFDGEM